MPDECEENKCRVGRFLEHVLPIDALPWNRKRKKRLQSVENDLVSIHTCKSNASMEIRCGCRRQTHVRMIGDDGAAFDISDKVNR